MPKVEPNLFADALLDQNPLGHSRVVLPYSVLECIGKITGTKPPNISSGDSSSITPVSQRCSLTFILFHLGANENSKRWAVCLIQYLKQNSSSNTGLLSLNEIIGHFIQIAGLFEQNLTEEQHKNRELVRNLVLRFLDLFQEKCGKSRVTSSMTTSFMKSSTDSNSAALSASDCALSKKNSRSNHAALSASDCASSKKKDCCFDDFLNGVDELTAFAAFIIAILTKDTRPRKMSAIVDLGAAVVQGAAVQDDEDGWVAPDAPVAPVEPVEQVAEQEFNPLGMFECLKSS